MTKRAAVDLAGAYTRFRELGSLIVDQESVIGRGSHGTSVYLGEFERQRVAVKSIVKHQFALAEAEVRIVLTHCFDS